MASQAAPSTSGSQPIKVKRPANTAFKQQRLKAWQPILTPKTVLPTFFAIGVIFIPLGIGLYIASDKVQQVIFDYTSCPSAPSSAPSSINSWTYSGNTCTVTFTINSDMIGPVYLYYRLTNFFQNHRRYVKSFDASQLLGSASASSSLCDPLANPNQANLISDYYTWLNGSAPPAGAYIYPCGLIANSYFSDVIGPLVSQSNNITFSSSGITWPSDSSKYSNLNVPNGDYSLVFPPPQWTKAFPDGGPFNKGYNASSFPKIANNERFQVWMRPAGLPNFRKLWGVVNGNIPAGTYTMTIVNNFDVQSFGGTKSIVISTVSILGGKNPFLGIAYITVGVICWVLGIGFLIREMIKPRKLGDYTYLSWNQPQQGSTPPS
jgi:hypothetical protein